MEYKNSSFFTIMTVLFIFSSIISTQAKPPGKRPQNPAAIISEGAPSKAGKSATGKARKAKQEDWWVNPCALPDGGNRHTPVEEVNSQQIPINHSPDFPSWITQLNISISQLKIIQEIYKDIEPHLNADDFKHEWLPEMPMEWLQKQPKNVKEVHAMTELYKGLQRFAVTIECLLGGTSCKKNKKEKKNRRQNPRTARSVDDVARRALLEEIKFGLKKLLCEVQMILREKKKHGQKLPVPPTSVIIDVNRFMLDPDEIGKMTQDFGVLKRYERYLLQWERIARELLVATTTSPPAKTKKEQRGRNSERNKNKQPKGKKQQKENKQPVVDDKIAPPLSPRTRHNPKRVKSPLVSI